MQCVIFNTDSDDMTLALDDKTQERHFDWSGVPIDLGGMEPLDQIARLVCHALVAPAAALTITEGGRLRVLAARGISIGHVEQAIASCCQVNAAANGVSELIGHSALAPIQLGDAAFPGLPARFIACVPVGTPQTGVSGTLCVIDTRERHLASQEHQQLLMFANVAAAQLELQFGAGRREPHSGLLNARQLQSDLDALAFGSHCVPTIASFIEVYDTQAANEARQALGMQPLEELIRHASYVLTRALRGKATVYHVAPMRFAFFLLNSAPDEMEDLLLDLRDMLHQPMDAAGVPMSLTFHAGVVRFAPQQPDTNDVMRKGLVALGDAINNHAIVCWYSALHDDAIQRSYRLALDAERALDAGDFRLVFQPRIDLADLSVTGFEALLRWHHASLGPIGPDEFIPLFEKTALMCTVTNWVIETALVQLAKWRAQGLDFSISINLSSRDFGNLNLGPAGLQLPGLARGLQRAGLCLAQCHRQPGTCRPAVPARSGVHQRARGQSGCVVSAQRTEASRRLCTASVERAACPLQCTAAQSRAGLRPVFLRVPVPQRAERARTHGRLAQALPHACGVPAGNLA